MSLVDGLSTTSKKFYSGINTMKVIVKFISAIAKTKQNKVTGSPGQIIVVGDDGELKAVDVSTVVNQCQLITDERITEIVDDAYGATQTDNKNSASQGTLTL